MFFFIVKHVGLAVLLGYLFLYNPNEEIGLCAYVPLSVLKEAAGSASASSPVPGTESTASLCSFSESYYEARDKFRRSAHSAGILHLYVYDCIRCGSTKYF